MSPGGELSRPAADPLPETPHGGEVPAEPAGTVAFGAGAGIVLEAVDWAVGVECEDPQAVAAPSPAVDTKATTTRAVVMRMGEQLDGSIM